jgi:cobalt-zinc-cadmium resistance protein CzcA
LQKLPGVSGVHIRHVLGKTNLVFRVDPDKCASWGVSAADVNKFIVAALGGQASSHMVEGEKLFDIVIRWPKVLRTNETSILDIPVDIVNNQVALASGPAVNPPPAGSGQPPPSKLGGQTDTANPITSTPRRTLRDFVTPLSVDGKPDPRGSFERPGAASIWRENGRRLIAVRFSIRGRGEADVLAEAREKLGPLFQAPYEAVWSGGAR